MLLPEALYTKPELQILPAAAGSQGATSVSSSLSGGEEAVEAVCSSSTSGAQAMLCYGDVNLAWGIEDQALMCCFLMLTEDPVFL